MSEVKNFSKEKIQQMIKDQQIYTSFKKIIMELQPKVNILKEMINQCDVVINDIKTPLQNKTLENKKKSVYQNVLKCIFDSIRDGGKNLSVVITDALVNNLILVKNHINNYLNLKLEIKNQNENKKVFIQKNFVVNQNIVRPCSKPFEKFDPIEDIDLFQYNRENVQTFSKSFDQDEESNLFEITDNDTIMEDKKLEDDLNFRSGVYSSFPNVIKENIDKDKVIEHRISDFLEFNNDGLN